MNSSHTVFTAWLFAVLSCVPLSLLSTNIFVHFLIFRKIKVWDLMAALDPRAPAGTLCLRTLVVRALLLKGADKQVGEEIKC